MKKAIIYGAGNIYNQIKHLLKREYEVIAFVDDDKKRWNSFFDNIIILSPQSISQLNYDVIFVATTKYESVLNNLIKLKVNVNKIKKLTEYISKNEKGIFTSNNIKVVYNSAQDRCAINEIFENNIYNFKSYFQHIIILDIGMNIGAASLYFANMKNVYKVYCFEPFKSTFNKAIENFELNPDLKNKIIAFNSGIGDSKHEVTLNYCENVSGSMSTIPDLNQKFYKTHQEHYTFINTQVSILDIFEEINKIKSVHKRNPVFCKIDCEGYEGRIIERLYSTDSLCKINLLMMECHDKPIKNKIITMLLEKKFTCYDFEINGYSNSMLYAYR